MKSYLFTIDIPLEQTAERCEILRNQITSTATDLLVRQYHTSHTARKDVRNLWDCEFTKNMSGKTRGGELHSMFTLDNITA